MHDHIFTKVSLKNNIYEIHHMYEAEKWRLLVH